MRGFFYPQSVAVLGVSPRFTNLGRAITVNLIEHHFTGRLVLVGPSGGNLYGHRIHPSLEEVDEPLDAAVILTPAATVPGLVRACGVKGVKRVVIESGGFGEYDDSRRTLEAELVAAAKEFDIRFIGPNGIGVMNKENGFVTPFPKVSTNLKQGEISLICQSGGVGLTYVNLLNSERLGINKFASVGNKLNVDEADLLEYFLADPGTSVVCLYLESISDGRRLMDLARSTDKPILIHKSNVSPASARIAASHTAALAADDAVVEAAFRQAGIIRVRQTRDMINYLKILTKPRMKGRRVAIVSRSGGHAVIAADACAANGLTLPQFPREFLDQFETHFRGGVIKIQNPIDLGDLFDFSVYSAIAEAMLGREEVDGLLFCHGYRGAETPQSRQFITALASLAERSGKAAALSLLVEEAEMASVKQRYDFPIYGSTEEAADCLRVSRLVWENSHDRRGAAAPTAGDWPLEKVARALASHPAGLAQALAVAEAVGLPVAPWRPADSAEAVLAAGRELGYPLALKAGAAEVSHKSDLGGVILNLADEASLTHGLTDLTANLAKAGAPVWPVVVQRMVPSGLEVILGGRQDPVFGPALLAGLGGVLVEVLGDVVLRVAPLDQPEARVMLRQLKAARLLDGHRGRPAADQEALAEALVRLGQLLLTCPQIREIDLNPVKALPPGQGLTVVDARLVLADG